MHVLTEPKSNSRRANRRVALLRRMGLFGDGLREVAFIRAMSMADLVGAYSLVHDTFVEEGYIPPNSAGLRLRTYEALPETATFIARHNGQVIGVSALITDSRDLGLPSDRVYGAQIDTLRGPRRIICEITDQAVSADWRGTAVATELMRCLFAHALAIGCTDFVCAVNPGHAKFYELLGFRRLGNVKSYSDAADDPVLLMHMADLAHRFDGVVSSDTDAEGFMRKYYLDENSFRRHVESWDLIAERLFLDPPSLRELFLTRSGLLERCSQSELEAIRRRWGVDVFDSVCTATALAAPLRRVSA